MNYVFSLKEIYLSMEFLLPWNCLKFRLKLKQINICGAFPVLCTGSTTHTYIYIGKKNIILKKIALNSDFDINFLFSCVTHILLVQSVVLWSSTLGISRYTEHKTTYISIWFFLLLYGWKRNKLFKKRTVVEDVNLNVSSELLF